MHPFFLKSKLPPFSSHSLPTTHISRNNPNTPLSSSSSSSNSNTHPTQFPYALAALPPTLSSDWDSPDFAPYRNAFPAEYRSSPTAFAAHVHALTAADTKAPYLKALQGHLWARGYATGALTCPLFPDVAPRLRAWTSSSPTASSSSSAATTSESPAPPLTLMIYSSGSIPAQKLLFAHTDAGDLTPLLHDYFDTQTAGPKTESASYVKIMEKYRNGAGTTQQQQWQPHEWLFLSDNAREVRAALEAGMQACAVVRPGNPPLLGEGEGELSVVRSFDEVRVGGGGGT